MVIVKWTAWNQHGSSLGRPNREVLNSACDLRMAQQFTFQHDNGLKPTAETAQECLKDKCLTMLERS